VISSKAAVISQFSHYETEHFFFFAWRDVFGENSLLFESETVAK